MIKVQLGSSQVIHRVISDNLLLFFNEFLGTALLAIGVFAVSDETNCPATHSTKPIAIGLLLNGIGLTFGYNTGFSINPARDFGPRLFTSWAGWGFDVFEYSNGYFWIPIVAPFLGAIVGAGFYYFFIEAPHKRKLIWDSRVRKAVGGQQERMEYASLNAPEL